MSHVATSTQDSSRESQELFWAESLPRSQLTELSGQSSSAPTLPYSIRGLVHHDVPEAMQPGKRGPLELRGGAIIPTKDMESPSQQ